MLYNICSTDVQRVMRSYSDRRTQQIALHMFDRDVQCRMRYTF